MDEDENERPYYTREAFGMGVVLLIFGYAGQDTEFFTWFGVVVLILSLMDALLYHTEVLEVEDGES